MEPNDKTSEKKYIKVVINSEYGGFALSPKAVEKLAERKGLKCYFFKNEAKDGKAILTRLTEYPTGLFWSAFSTDNPEEFDYETNYLPYRPTDREDPDLVAVVEELGEEANGRHAKLKIIEIPADIKWHISDYDGQEWVAEDHRTWS